MIRMLCKLLSDYLIRTYVAQKDFQSAINIIQARSDNPGNDVDSLRALLDLEIVLQLAAMEEDKRPVYTKYSQYSYPNTEVYYNKHAEHWAMLNKLLYGDEPTGPPIPSTPLISRNYPNPFNPSTTIEFSVPETGRVRLVVYNIRGQRVRSLLDTEL